MTTFEEIELWFNSAHLITSPELGKALGYIEWLLAEQERVGRIAKAATLSGHVTHDRIYEWCRVLVARYGISDDAQMIEWLRRLGTAIAASEPPHPVTHPVILDTAAPGWPDVDTTR